MSMHEFWELLPTWEVIVFSIYCLFLTVYFFVSMIVGVDDNDTPFFILSRVGYDVLAGPVWICLFIWELFMLPAQLLLLTIYGLVQWTWTLKDRPKRKKDKKAKKAKK